MLTLCREHDRGYAPALLRGGEQPKDRCKPASIWCRRSHRTLLDRSKQQWGPLRLRSGQAFDYVRQAPHFVQDDRISKGREEAKMSDLHLEARR
jgi:hypothetical protein